MRQCIGDRGTSCESQCPHAFEDLPPPDSEESKAVLETHAVARHYGASSFSYTKLLRSVMASNQQQDSGGGAPMAPEGVRKCEFFSLLYQDW